MSFFSTIAFKNSHLLCDLLSEVAGLYHHHGKNIDWTMRCQADTLSCDLRKSKLISYLYIYTYHCHHP